MNKTEEARSLLRDLNVPDKLQTDVCCHVLLAMADISEGDAWSKATNQWLSIHEIMASANNKFAAEYKDSSREIFRKFAVYNFRQEAFVEDTREANGPNYRFRLTEETLDLVRSYGKVDWVDKKAKFIAAHKD